MRDPGPRTGILHTPNTTMAHEVTNAAYSLKPAWHGLGVVLDHRMSVEEAMHAAQLTWNPLRVPIQTSDGTRIQGHRAIVRSDTRAPLGIVSDRYRVIPHSKLAEIAEQVTDIQPGATVESALELRGGREIVLLIRLGGYEMGKGKVDPTENYLCLATTHDGSGALRAFPTAIRVVCKNTLSMADHREAARQLRVSHHGDNVEVRLESLEDAITYAVQGLSQWEDLARRFEGWRLTDKEAGSILTVAAELQSPRPDPAEDPERFRSWSQRMDTTVRRILETPSYSEDDRTAWALFNKATAYWQHYRGSEGTRKQRAIDPNSRDNNRKRELAAAMETMLS